MPSPTLRDLVPLSRHIQHRHWLALAAGGPCPWRSASSFKICLAIDIAGKQGACSPLCYCPSPGLRQLMWTGSGRTDCRQCGSGALHFESGLFYMAQTWCNVILKILNMILSLPLKFFSVSLFFCPNNQIPYPSTSIFHGLRESKQGRNKCARGQHLDPRVFHCSESTEKKHICQTLAGVSLLAQF